MLSEDGGCIDVDECAVGNNECSKDEFCINKDGSYECLSMNIIANYAKFHIIIVFNSTKITRFMVPICLNFIHSLNFSFLVKLSNSEKIVESFILECDRSCDQCSGDGPDLCNKCAEGYELRNGLCTGKSKLFAFPSYYISGRGNRLLYTYIQRSSMY